MESESFADTEVPFWRKRRYHVVLMVFFGLVNLLTLRVTLSVAIVQMIQKTNVTLEDGTVVEEQEFDWDSTTVGYILSSYFYGYITTQILGGLLASRFGPHLVFGIGIGSNAVLVLLIPVATKANVAFLITIRVLQGVIGGVTYPSILGIWSQWAPVYERAFMGNVAYTGNYVGLIAAMALSGLMTVAWGWESVFYVFGVVGCIWYIAWVFVVRANAESDPFIKEAEKKYIISSIGERSKHKNIKHPWKDILLSPAVWAVSVANFVSMFGTFMLLTELPLFLNDTMDFELNTTGILAAIPYIVGIVFLFIAGYSADWVQVKGYLRTGQVRRYWNCVSCLVEMVFMILTTVATTPALTITYISLAVGASTFSFAGYLANALDLAPTHASVIHGITNSFGTLAGILAPMITGYIVTDKKVEQYHIVFYITAGIYLFGAVFYWFFCRGNLQPWAKIDLAEKEAKKTTVQ
ncbi:vesicular glutamate transporter 1-like [Phlebotomus argentipes]|uniref:vesicular glutamate transporter 1-like n=1 Tax=Phlebotomus argentipes TaxID=94469 RepID=UPI0028936941|nr:vesicular glutamate transporter 1-like [Phlebotomus argentipes]